jgi:hypothetical protein
VKACHLSCDLSVAAELVRHFSESCMSLVAHETI